MFVENITPAIIGTLLSNERRQMPFGLAGLFMRAAPDLGNYELSCIASVNGKCFLGTLFRSLRPRWRLHFNVIDEVKKRLTTNLSS
jgi:hypothetical protein